MLAESVYEQLQCEGLRICLRVKICSVIIYAQK